MHEMKTFVQQVDERININTFDLYNILNSIKNAAIFANWKINSDFPRLEQPLFAPQSLPLIKHPLEA